MDVDDDLGLVLGDYIHIYQIFSNLVSNAIGHNDSKAPMIEIKSLDMMSRAATDTSYATMAREFLRRTWR